MIGLREQVLGAGMLIGAIDDEGLGEMPVIAIEDGEKTVEILGVECYWLPIDDVVIGMLAHPEVAQTIVRATTYVQMLEATFN